MSLSKYFFNNKSDFEALKVRLLPLPDIKLHKDYDWVYQQYTDYSKQYPDHNKVISDLVNLATCYAINRGQPKEKIVMCELMTDYMYYLYQIFEPIRKQKSEPKLREVIKRLHEVLDTEKCDDDFTIG